MKRLPPSLKHKILLCYPKSFFRNVRLARAYQSFKNTTPKRSSLMEKIEEYEFLNLDHFGHETRETACFLSQ